MKVSRRIGEATAVKTPGYPIIPLFFLMASLGLMVIAFVNRPIESVSTIFTIIIGVPLFYFWRKRFKSH
jgi:APA family basic amino acid/polyamine antiporter